MQFADRVRGPADDFNCRRSCARSGYGKRTGGFHAAVRAFRRRTSSTAAAPAGIERAGGFSDSSFKSNLRAA